MGRKRVEINPERGKRLKELLGDYDMTQQDLASRLGYAKEHLTLMVNRKRNITEEAAEAIIQMFPGTRKEWLLGFDDYKTENDYIGAILGGRRTCRDLIIQLMEMHGYEIVTDTFDWEPVETDKETGKESKRVHYGIRSKKGCVYIGPNEIERIIDEINNFVDFKCSFDLLTPEGKGDRAVIVAENYHKKTGGKNNG